MLSLRAQFYLRVAMDDRFIIPLNGLTAGENKFFWHAGKEFFDSFENTEVLDAQLDIDVRVEKSGRYVGVDCYVRDCNCSRNQVVGMVRIEQVLFDEVCHTDLVLNM